LLDLLGEVLTPPAPASPAPARTGATPKDDKAPAEPPDLWTRTQAGVAPLKRKK